MQMFTLGGVLGLAVLLGIVSNQIDRIEKAVVKPHVTQTACKLT